MHREKSHIERKQLHELMQARENNLRELKSFDLDHIGVINGVNMYNDSSATSMDKVADSLSMFDQPVVWIAEANNLRQNFEMLAEVVSEKVKAIIAVGDHSDLILSQLWNASQLFVPASTWSEALEFSLDVAKANDSVLMSPGCKTSEPFQNFRERGAYFNRLVELTRSAEN